MSVQLDIAAGYLSDFENPLGVSVMSKLTQWPILQQLGYAGSLTHINQNFHGVKDFYDQMTAYSSTHAILIAAWQAIKQLAPKNPEVLATMFVSPVLGQVGNEFLALSSFGQAFAITPDQLKIPSAITSAVQSLGQPTPPAANTLDTTGGGFTTVPSVDSSGGTETTGVTVVED